MGSGPDWHVSMVDIHLQKLLGWTALDMPEWRETTEQIDWRAKQPSQVACVLKTEVLRSLRHWLRAQSHGHHTIDRLEERGVEKESARRSSLKGRERAIVNQKTIGTVSKATLGKTSEGWDGAHKVFTERVNIILNTFCTIKSPQTTPVRLHP